MQTILFIENLPTTKIRKMLKVYEDLLYKIDSNIITSKKLNVDCQEDENDATDLEIDVNLLRMELNKRLWNENLTN